ncbi:VOC family protein [Natronosalvus halobius]|uniref:VOC family protein n=1 Tax=Natronosalvus halobius TaxID=2953746 RepID=UPI00209E29DE|nr:VOC family protein [Natronosalvus halobius]USZ72228.1 VOC family protein [Natronosalvus halobius]
MHVNGVHHFVLLVDDVPDGESYYKELFDLEVLFREAALDGEPGIVPEDVSWDEALDRGVTPYMSFLGRDEFYVAVGGASDQQGTGRLDHIALAVDEEAFDAITDRANALRCDVEENAPHHQVFLDRYDIEWELNAKPPTTQADV